METKGDVDKLVKLFDSIKKDIGEMKGEIEKKVKCFTLAFNRIHK